MNKKGGQQKLQKQKNINQNHIYTNQHRIATGKHHSKLEDSYWNMIEKMISSKDPSFVLLELSRMQEKDLDYIYEKYSDDEYKKAVKNKYKGGSIDKIAVVFALTIIFYNIGLAGAMPIQRSANGQRLAAYGSNVGHISTASPYSTPIIHNKTNDYKNYDYGKRMKRAILRRNYKRSNEYKQEQDTVHKSSTNSVPQKEQGFTDIGESQFCNDQRNGGLFGYKNFTNLSLKQGKTEFFDIPKLDDYESTTEINESPEQKNQNTTNKNADWLWKKIDKLQEEFESENVNTTKLIQNNEIKEEKNINNNANSAHDNVVKFYEAALGYSNNILTSYEDGIKPRRNEIKCDTDNIVRIKINSDHHITSQQAKSFLESSFIPALEKLTNGYIRLDLNARKENIINIEHVNANSSFAMSTGSNIKLSLPREEVSNEIVVHEFLHSLGIAHPFNGPPMLLIDGNIMIQDPLYDNDNIINQKHSVNTVMGYGTLNFNGLKIGHFNYIMNPQNNIWNTLDSKSQAGISEFVEKYGYLMELGLTPMDICDLSAQYGDPKIAKEPLDIVAKAGIENFLFEAMRPGVINFKDHEIRIADIEQYCKKNNPTSYPSCNDEYYSIKDSVNHPELSLEQAEQDLKQAVNGTSLPSKEIIRNYKIANSQFIYKEQYEKKNEGKSNTNNNQKILIPTVTGSLLLAIFTAYIAIKCKNRQRNESRNSPPNIVDPRDLLPSENDIRIDETEFIDLKQTIIDESRKTEKEQAKKNQTKSLLTNEQKSLTEEEWKKITDAPPRKFTDANHFRQDRSNLSSEFSK